MIKEKKRKQKKGMGRISAFLLSALLLFNFFFLSCGMRVSARGEDGAFYDLSVRQELIHGDGSSKPVVRYRLEALDGAPLPEDASGTYDFSVEGTGAHTAGRIFFNRPGLYRYNLYAISIQAQSGVWKLDERHYRLEANVYHTGEGDGKWTVILIIKNEAGSKEAEIVFEHEQKENPSKPPINPPKPPVDPSKPPVIPPKPPVNPPKPPVNPSKPPVNPTTPTVKPVESPRTGVTIRPFVSLLVLSSGFFLLTVCRGKGKKIGHRDAYVD